MLAVLASCVSKGLCYVREACRRLLMPAKLAVQINYANKAMLVGALIVAGWDEAGGGQVYGVPIGGTLVRQQWTTDGSGSTYLWGYLDSSYKYAMLCSLWSFTPSEVLLSTSIAFTLCAQV